MWGFPGRYQPSGCPSAACLPPAGQHCGVGALVRAHGGGIRGPLHQAAGPQRLPMAGCQVPEPLLHTAADPGGGTQASATWSRVPCLFPSGPVVVESGVRREGPCAVLWGWPGRFSPPQASRPSVPCGSSAARFSASLVRHVLTLFAFPG